MAIFTLNDVRLDKKSNFPDMFPGAHEKVEAWCECHMQTHPNRRRDAIDYLNKAGGDGDYTVYEIVEAMHIASAQPCFDSLGCFEGWLISDGCDEDDDYNS